MWVQVFYPVLASILSNIYQGLMNMYLNIFSFKLVTELSVFFFSLHMHWKYNIHACLVYILINLFYNNLMHWCLVLVMQKPITITQRVTL